MFGRKLAAVALSAACAAVLIGGCGGGSEPEKPSKPFAPRVSLTAIGGTARTEKPEFVIVVKARPGDANVLSAAVNLPPVVFVDQTALGDICSRKELEIDRCKGHGRMGFARVATPAYRGTLSGPVYAVSGYGGLPRLAYVLRGPGGVEAILHGRIVTKGLRIQAGVENVPSTPLKTFEFRIEGGKPGYLILSRDICRRNPTADAFFRSQNGEVHTQKAPLRAECP
jgi:hypothetical protein